MTVTNNTSANRRASGRSGTWLSRLKVSRYDRISGMLIAVLILLGLFVIGMFAVWVTNRLATSTDDIKPQTWKLGIGKKELPPGPGNDIEPPPPSETDLAQVDPKDRLNAVEAVEATIGARFVGPPDGIGDKNTIGNKDGGGPRGKPQRWQLRFPKGNTLQTYAQQLDHFGIELGVLIPDNQVLYVGDLLRSRPTTRKGPRDQEQRYRFTFVEGDLENADRELLARAGVSFEGGLIYKFLPPRLYGTLRDLEAEHAGGKKVRSTLFGIKSDGNEYRFYVMRQSYYH